MNRRNNQVSLKLDSSPKQPTTPGAKKPPRFRSPITRSNLLSFVFGFVSSGFIYLSMWSPTMIEPRPESPHSDDHRAAIVVPFRDRFDELEQFVPHLSRFLSNKSIAFDIWIVNQADSLRFNRAALINAGFLASASTADYMIMHDVDLLPLNDRLDYSYPPATGPVHITAAGLHPEYNYSTFIGGILSIRREHFLRTNGMSNRYWGWGKEDDEFGLRLKEANLSVRRPSIDDFPTGRRFTFRDLHAHTRRPRDKKRFPKQKNESLRRDETGLSNLQYRVDGIRKLTFSNEFSCYLIDVILFCDRRDTHWCTTDFQFYD